MKRNEPKKNLEKPSQPTSHGRPNLPERMNSFIQAGIAGFSPTALLTL
jgi:hypothetical protein